MTTGGLSRECLVYGWQSVKACLDATAKGYKTVVMPGEYFYFDMRQTPQEEGHDWAAVFDAKKVFGFDFTEKGFSDEQMRNVVGLQGTFFSEAYVSHEPEKPDYLDYMCFPRICALARIAWRGNCEGWDAYYRELTDHYDRMAAMGIRFRLFPPKVSYKEGAFTVVADDGSEIFYLKGDSPERASVHRPHQNRQTASLPLPDALQDGTQSLCDRQILLQDPCARRDDHHLDGRKHAVPHTNASAYKGLARTRRACRQQDWILYTYEQPVKCREMFLQTGNRQLPKTIITTGYAEVSYDGTTYERAGDLEKGSITLKPGRPVKSVRIVSTCDDNGTPHVTIQPPQIKPVL